MSGVGNLFGMPGFFRMLMESKGLPFSSSYKDEDGVEVTGEAAQAYMLTMLAAGAGNGNVPGVWSTHW